MSIIVIDFETGGVLPHHPSIQLAAVAVNEAWHEVASFERKLAFNAADAEPEALELNHYSAEAWADALPPADAFREFAGWLNTFKSVEMVSNRTGRSYKVARLAAYNVPFDKDRLWAMSSGEFVPAHPQALCILQLAQWCQHAGLMTVDNLKLATVAEALNIDCANAHEAMADVRMAVAVARELKRRLLSAHPAPTSCS